MSSTAPPIIAFELGVGEFRIVTPGAVYQIKVCHDLVEATKEAETARPGEAPATFFKEISEELYDQIGRLARKLSVSVEELPEQLSAPDLDRTDQQLENAKGQLEEIVKITEKASMSIMDSADQIQVDMDELKSQLGILQSLDLMAEPVVEVSVDQAPQVNILGRTPANPAFFDKLKELKDFVDGLLAGGPETPGEPGPAETDSAGSPAPDQGPPEPEIQAAAPASVTVSEVRFDVDVVFQTLYELCTNESVKEHIKLMREAQSTSFNAGEVAAKLSEMAPTTDEEDGFYNFPIPSVLKTLYAATNSEDFRTTLKKMNQTAASIFLDSVLPIEGETVEVEVPAPAGPEPVQPPAPPEPETPAEPSPPALSCSAEDLKAIQKLALEIEELGQGALTPAPEADGVVIEAQESRGLYTSILTQDRDTIVKAVSTAHQLIGQTSSHLTHILETLAFQDLSGQRIMKVVSLMGDIQMQLLSILVSVRTKLKVHEESADLGAKSEMTEKMAQEEVDKALGKVAASNSSLLGPGAEARLDQSAVNDLLAQLGF